MIARFFNWLSAGKPTESRSKGWPGVRRLHLVTEPRCAGCGRADELEVHHIKPFHKFPNLELLDSNLITLCEGSGRNCHYTLGHCYDWKGWNPNVRTDAATFRSRVEESKKLSLT